MTMYKEDMKQLKEIQAFLELTQPSAINKRYQTTLSNAISAIKTIEDMGVPLTPRQIDMCGVLTLTVNPNVSRETLEEIAKHDCGGIHCTDCQYETIDGICVSSLCDKILRRLNNAKNNRP